MAEVLDLNKNTPAKPRTETAVGTQDEADLVHKHAEREAMDAAKRASERMKKNEAGNDIIDK